jgi:RimJ/RimL family protein N-acetyltransferase
MSAPETIDTSNLRLTWSEAPWDSAIFGCPVLQIGQMEVRGADADKDFTAFETARDGIGACLVSCRLPHDHLRESMLLEGHGFRFIEMVYHPELDDLASREYPDAGLSVSRATSQDLPETLAIADHVFSNERFHMDPRLGPHLGDQRYCNWVRSSIEHPSQRLFLLRDGGRPVAFFVTESRDDGTCYWHLNAVAREAQGQGYGRRAWYAMLRQAREQGAKRVQTCIVARNYRVLNLYARLGFFFPAPLMTFHWVTAPAATRLSV